MSGRKELRLIELAMWNLREITRAEFDLLMCGWAPPELLERAVEVSDPARLVLETGPRPAHCP